MSETTNSVVLKSTDWVDSPGMARYITHAARTDVGALDMAIGLLESAPAWTVAALLRGIYTVDEDAATVTFNLDDYRARDRQQGGAILAHLRPDDDEF